MQARAALAVTGVRAALVEAEFDWPDRAQEATTTIIAQVMAT